jgi:hypothetical protein
MAPTVLCPRHVHAASVLACDHVSAAVNCGSEPPAFLRLRVTLDSPETVTFRACFDCVDQFDLASYVSAPPDAKVDVSKFPKINPICVKCLEATQSPHSDPDAIPPTSRTRTRVRPTQVSTAVLLLCVSLGIDVVTSPPLLEQFLFGGSLLLYAMWAWMTYNIWMGRYWARGLYAVLVGPSIVLYVLSPGIEINILQSLIDLAALYLLFTAPGRGWFQAESSFP